MRRLIRCATVLALACAPAALAAGPSLPPLEGQGGIATATGNTRYVAMPSGASTTLGVVRTSDGSVIRFRSLAGRFGIPIVAYDGSVGGLSADGKLLVLTDWIPPAGALRRQSDFTLVSTRTLRPLQTVRLRGDFGFDALSPDGRTLYLIQHVSTQDVSSYRVRAYDLRTKRLLARVIADKREGTSVMSGFPVTRAASPDGRWVYTLYRRDGNTPFVHALDAATRTAVCIDVPWPPASSQDAVMRARLHLEAGKLTIDGAGSGKSFVLDTSTFHISTLTSTP
jgi:hypothetical protein